MEVRPVADHLGDNLDDLADVAPGATVVDLFDPDRDDRLTRMAGGRRRTRERGPSCFSATPPNSVLARWFSCSGSTRCRSCG